MNEKFENVTVLCKANVFFDGKVVSHTVLVGGARKTLGLIYPGTYTFDTKAAELMEITAGACRARIKGQKDFTAYAAGSSFRVAANSAFDIEVADGICQYICSFE